MIVIDVMTGRRFFKVECFKRLQRLAGNRPAFVADTVGAARRTETSRTRRQSAPFSCRCGSAAFLQASVRAVHELAGWHVRNKIRCIRFFACHFSDIPGCHSHRWCLPNESGDCHQNLGNDFEMRFSQQPLNFTPKKIATKIRP